MKNLFILLGVFVSINLSGQVKPIVEFTMGYNDWRNHIKLYTENNKYKYSSDIAKYPIYSDILIGAKYKNITITQSIENYFGAKNIMVSKTFMPKQITYTTSFKFKIKSMEIGYDHMCSHQIVGEMPIDGPLDIAKMFSSSYDKFYIKFKIY